MRPGAITVKKVSALRWLAVNIAPIFTESCKMKVKCPTCDIDVVWSAESKFRPFCSERCKLIDLGDWAAENHRIADKAATDPQLTEEYLAELEQQFIAQDNDFFKH
jgi:uncharacterized protein